MPCPACGEDPEGTEWKADPLRWDLDPPCSEAEWAYLADVPQAPEFMASQKCGYMNHICRGCYSNRMQVAAKVRSRIRQQGGIESMRPTQRMQREYEVAHAFDIVANRPARIHGLQSPSAAPLNGQFCKLVSKDEQTQRWTVELLNGEQKSIKESNLEVSKDIDSEFEFARGKYMVERQNQPQAQQQRAAAAGANGGGSNTAVTGAKAAEAGEDKRPLGQKTAWPKVKGIHPGAVVRLRDLKGAPELNGRRGRCISFDPETGRWQVDLGDERKALKLDNLTPAPGEKPPTKESAEADKKASVATSERRSQMSAKEVFAETYGWDG